ncbi:MAG: hypothetical protein FD124_1382 [Alphaproteobacteria bacterium]|nr:MAG: hypothetical protein FD124_1382 [Alphaproteobacteria bacterium]
MTRPATHRDLQHMHNWLRVEMALQTLVVLGVLITVYFGTVASNQASGSLGMSLGQSIEQSRAAFREDMVRELDRREAVRREQEAAQRAKSK